MSRAKPKIHPVKALAQANAVLGEIAALKRTCAAIEDSLNENVDRLQAQAEAAAAGPKSRLAQLELGLAAFAVHNKEELFSESRSCELTFGEIGFRRSSEIKPQSKSTWAMVLGKIKELGFVAALRIKEEVDREELRRWPAERLELVSAQRVEKDVFWYEITEAALADSSAKVA